MKYRVATLLLSLCLFVLSTNRAEACGSDDAKHTARLHEEPSDESCCATDEAQPDCCADDTEHQPSETSCPCDHENGGCHCPGCHIVVHSVVAFTLETPADFTAHTLNFSVHRQAFYFSDHLPEAVYLPIWQPPKITVSRNAVPAIS